MSATANDDNGKQLYCGNPHIAPMSDDVLYHIGLSTQTHDLRKMFSDVKFVVVGGSSRRMQAFAGYLLTALDISLPAGQALDNIAASSDRFALYKVGPVLAASHGIGVASCSVVMHELIKILYHAGATDVCAFRIGTSGGIGITPGTVVISTSIVDGLFRPYMELAILGQLVRRPCSVDERLSAELLSCARPEDGFSTIAAKTMCTADFYEGQGRLDGAFCDFSEADKMAFLSKALESGVRNIEMESLCFAAMCRHANVKCAVACVALLDRLHGDQVDAGQDKIQEWDARPATLVARLIRRRLGLE